MRWRGKCVVKDWPGRSLLAMCEDQAEGAWPSVAPERQRLAARGLIVYNPMAAWLTLCVYGVVCDKLITVVCNIQLHRPTIAAFIAFLCGRIENKKTKSDWM